MPGNQHLIGPVCASLTTTEGMEIESGIWTMQNREHDCEIYKGCSKKGVVDNVIQIT